MRILFHDGWSGVDLFFVLSGFLIGGQFFQTIAAGRQLSIGRFYVKRFLRTFPNYYLTLSVLFGFLGSLDARPTQPIWHYVFFIQNFGRLAGFAPSWSLCVEEHFYLVFPLIVWALRRSVRTGRIARSGAKLIVAGLVFEMLLRWAIWHHVRPDIYDPARFDEAYLRFCQWIYYPTYARLDGIVVGVGLAALRVFRPERWSRLLKARPTLLAAGGAVLAAASIAIHWRMGLSGSVFGFTLLAVGFGLLLIPASALQTVRARWLDWSVYWIAQLSFALYLVNLPAMRFAERLVGSHGAPLLALTGGALMLAASLALYFGVERPMLVVRERVLGARAARVGALA